MSNLCEKKRIAFLFGHLHNGGMQKAVSNISCALPEEFEQYVLFFGSENPAFNYNAKLVNLNVPGKRDRTFVSRIYNCLKRMEVLQKFIDSNRISTVISFGEVASLLSLMTKRTKKVVSVRVSVDEQFDNLGIYGWGMKQLVRLLYPQADIVIPVSKALEAQIVDKYWVSREKVRTIYNLYDIDTIQHLSKETLSLEEKEIFKMPTIINVGSLCYQKGQDHLIQAFARGKSKCPDLQLVIIGDGKLNNDLKQLGTSLGVSDSIHLFGFRSNPYKYIANADVFVLTSRFEGFPNVLVEAMACGTPVISTDCQTGPKEILGDSEYGILIPQILHDGYNIEILVDAIMNMLNFPIAQSYSRKAIYRANSFEKSKIIQNWIEVLA